MPINLMVVAHVGIKTDICRKINGESFNNTKLSDLCSKTTFQNILETHQVFKLL